MKCFVCGDSIDKTGGSKPKDGKRTCSRKCSSEKQSMKARRKIERKLRIDNLKTFIENKYFEEELPVREIARLIYGRRSYSPNVLVWMDKFGIERRDRSTSVSLQWKDNDERRKKQGEIFREAHKGEVSHRRITNDELEIRCLKADASFLERWIEGSYTRLKCECKTCGYVYTKKLTNRSLSCPACAPSSWGEERIKRWMTSNGCEYVVEYKDDRCKGDCTHLPFDFAVFHEGELKYLIEFDGSQHFEASDFFGGERAFEQRKRYDKIKDNFCKENGIPLIRIPYWKVDDIEEILSNEIVIDLALF